MDYNDYVKLGLKNDGNLKVILKGSVEEASSWCCKCRIRN